MTLIVTSEYDLNRVAPPNLPNAPQLYDPRFQEQFNNILRLYFNQLNNILGQLKVSDEPDSVQTQLWLGNSGVMFSC